MSNVPTTPMNRARYLQLRADLANVLSFLKTIDVEAFLAMTTQALQQGPAQQPAFWQNDPKGVQLMADRALGTLLLAMKTLAIKGSP